MTPRLPGALSAMLCAAAALVGCSDSTRREEMKVVVEADRSRVTEDQQRLEEIRGNVVRDREALLLAREELAAARKRLTSTASAEERARLDQRESELLARERTMLQRDACAPPPTTTAASVPAAAPLELATTLTRKELDDALHAQEDRLRQLLATETERAVERVAFEASRGANKGQRLDVDSALKDLDRRRRQAGLLPSDVPGADRSALRLQRALDQGRIEDALAVIAEQREAIAAVRVDRPFVKSKYDRVRALVSTRPLTADARERVNGMLGEVATLVTDGDIAQANRRLSEIAEAN